MMLGQMALIGAALLAAQAQTGSHAPASPAAPAVKQMSKDEADALISKCGSRRFETSAEVPVNGKLRRTRITLCAADTETQAQWVAKLEKAAEQIESQATLPQPTKAKLLGELRAEIARVNAKQSFGLAGPSTMGSSTPSLALPNNGLSAQPTARSPLADFGGLPPLPPPPVVGSAAAIAANARAKGPRLAVRCAIVGVDREGGCGVIATDERLVVRAVEAFDGEVSLRFHRVDSVTADVPFASQGLRAGQTARFSIPKAICKGRVRAEFDIEVVTASSKGLGERLGPFEARCAL